MLDDNEASIVAYLEAKGWPYSLDGEWYRVRACPLCKSTARAPFALHRTTGSGKCHACGWIGGLHLLKIQLGDSVSPIANPPKPKIVPLAPDTLWTSPHETLTSSPKLLAAYCEHRGLTPETVAAFRIGVVEASRNGTTGMATTVPYFRDGKFAYRKVKLRTRDEDGKPDGGKIVWREPNGVESWLFNVDELKGTDRVVVCEGEEDCAVLTQAGIKNVVSMPDGANVSKLNRAPWLNRLEPFADIVLAFDGDKAGREGAAGMAKLLGEGRCRIVEWPRVEVAPGVFAKDPTDLARMGKVDEMRQAIDRAPGQDNPLVQHIGDPAGMDELRRDHESPMPHGLSTGWPSVNAHLGGIRPGEVTIVTGGTGCGKSAFASNLAINLADRGTPVLIASFELSLLDLRWRLVQHMTGKYPNVREDGTGEAMTVSDRERGIAALIEMPIYVVNRFGAMATTEYVAICRYAARRFGVRVCVLDHLTFMTQGAGDRERLAIQAAIYAVKDLAILTGLSMIVVCHPSRSARDKDLPDATDLHGSAALEQVADNVLAIGRGTGIEPHTTFALRKLRRGRSGKLGAWSIGFDRAGEAIIEPGMTGVTTRLWGSGWEAEDA